MQADGSDRVRYNWDALASLNAGRLIYFCLFASVVLQQFESTEPAASGFFWMNIVTMIIAEITWIEVGHQTKKGVCAFLIVLAIGQIAQLCVLCFFWDYLVKIDHALRCVRTLLGRGDPLLPMRVVLGLATIPFLLSVCKHGIVRRPNRWVINHW